MPNDPFKPVALSLPSAVLLAVSQAAVGCGLGLLLAGKIEEKKRSGAAVGLLSLALAATIPAIAAIVIELVNGPQSRLGVRRRLRSIREDSGLHAEEEVF
jgi:hypothetical protein